MSRHLTGIISKFLIVYVLFLALKPCADDHTIDYCQTEGIVHIENQHSEDHEDSCTPFCNCLCCNTLVSISKTHTLNYIHSAYHPGNAHTQIFPVSYKPTSPPPKA